MSFESDSRWDAVIAAMNFLSLTGYTGMIRFSLVNGRVHRRTVDDLHYVITLVKESQQHKESVHAEA